MSRKIDCSRGVQSTTNRDRERIGVNVLGPPMRIDFCPSRGLGHSYITPHSLHRGSAITI